MPILDFNAFALTRAEIKKIVGGEASNCGGTCTGFGYNASTGKYETTYGTCVQVKTGGKGKNKTYACQCNATGAKGGQC